MTSMTATNATSNVRLVHRPATTPNGTFVGWGPRLGSI
jgi:hypothetical protein